MKVFRLVGSVVVLMIPVLCACAQKAVRTKPNSMRMAAQTSHKTRVRGKTHTYYIEADEVKWNYLPNAPTYVHQRENELVKIPPAKSTSYLKAVYREYTDGTFTALKVRPPEWEHLGILGPLIRAEVGDVIRVVFRNNTRFISTIHAHGVAYDKESEGAYYGESATVPPDFSRKGNAVHKGEVFTYTWTVPERAGPGPGDPSSILWMYHSHFNESRDINSGLMGPIVISRKGSTRADGTPKDVDREFIVSFAIFDESSSNYYTPNVVVDQRYPEAITSNPNFAKALEYYTLNGFIRGTMPLLEMKKGERVRWYLMANGNEDDVHAPHWHGETVLSNSMRTDTVSIGPMSMTVADMKPANLGTWLFHCHVTDHIDGGMYALYKIVP